MAPKTKLHKCGVTARRANGTDHVCARPVRTSTEACWQHSAQKSKGLPRVLVNVVITEFDGVESHITRASGYYAMPEDSWKAEVGAAHRVMSQAIVALRRNRATRSDT